MKKKRKNNKKNLKKSGTTNKDHYTVVCQYNDGVTSYSPFHGTGEQLKKFALQKRKDKYEGKLPKRVKIELVG